MHNSSKKKLNTNIGREERKHEAEANTMLIICVRKHQRDAHSVLPLGSYEIVEELIANRFDDGALKGCTVKCV